MKRKYLIQNSSISQNCFSRFSSLPNLCLAQNCREVFSAPASFSQTCNLCFQFKGPEFGIHQFSNNITRLTNVSKANPTSVMPNVASDFTERCQRAVKIKSTKPMPSSPSVILSVVFEDLYTALHPTRRQKPELHKHHCVPNQVVLMRQ